MMGHVANQVTDLAFATRASGLAGLRLLLPIELETLSMPSDDGFRLHDRQGGSPGRPGPREHDPEDTVAGPKSRVFDGLPENGNLLPRCKVLKGGSLRLEEPSVGAQPRQEDQWEISEHGRAIPFSLLEQTNGLLCALRLQQQGFGLQQTPLRVQ